jgi:hypothetical protein
VQKYGTARKATDGNITGQMRFACWIIKATDTNTQNMSHLLLFYDKYGYANAPESYVFTSIACLFILRILRNIHKEIAGGTYNYHCDLKFYSRRKEEKQSAGGRVQRIVV